MNTNKIDSKKARSARIESALEKMADIDKRPANDEEKALFAFYAATSRTDLIATMSSHIDRLQAALPPLTNDRACQKVRVA